MAAGHKEAGLAALYALTGKRPMPKGYEKLLPQPDWNTARHRGGSGNIPLMAASGFYAAANTPAKVTLAWILVKNYAKFCKEQFMLNEPYSWIYGAWIFMSWIGIIMTARRRGDKDIEKEYKDLCKQYLAVGIALASHASKWAPYSGERAKNKLPRWIYVMCGARSWGHSTTDELGFYSIFDVALGAQKVKQYKTVWTTVALQNADVRACIRGLAEEMGAIRAHASLIPEYVKYPAKEFIQMMGWADGSRAFAMGTDEAEFVDDDPNSNTPGVLFFGCFGGKIIMAPGDPNPHDGKTRIRQKNVISDMDGTPHFGWVVVSNMIGNKEGNNFFTQIPAYVGSKLEFWYSMGTDGSFYDLLNSPRPVSRDPVDDIDTEVDKLIPKKKGWFQRFMEWWLGGGDE